VENGPTGTATAAADGSGTLNGTGSDVHTCTGTGGSSSSSSSSRGPQCHHHDDDWHEHEHCDYEQAPLLHVVLGLDSTEALADRIPTTHNTSASQQAACPLREGLLLSRSSQLDASPGDGGISGSIAQQRQRQQQQQEGELSQLSIVRAIVTVHNLNDTGQLSL
jgi:hypothetical protein